jgi:hypothetical protein
VRGRQGTYSGAHPELPGWPSRGEGCLCRAQRTALRPGRGSSQNPRHFGDIGRVHAAAAADDLSPLSYPLPGLAGGIP